MRVHLHWLVFIDEKSLNTKLTKQTGWSKRGERFYDYVPFGHWRMQTFIAGLRWHGLTAPWVLDAPMNRDAFTQYIETQLAPTLNKGDIVILDNLSFHKGAKAAEALKARGAWFLFSPALFPRLEPH